MQSGGSQTQKDYILNGSIYDVIQWFYLYDMTFNKGQHYMTESRSVVLGIGGEKRRLATKGHEGNLGVHRNVYIMIT